MSWPDPITAATTTNPDAPKAASLFPRAASTAAPRVAPVRLPPAATTRAAPGTIPCATSIPRAATAVASPSPGRRHSGGERSPRGEQSRGKQTPAGNRGAQGRPRNGAPSGRGSHAPRAGAAFAPQMHTLAPTGGFNLARAKMALIVIALAVIFAMALFHIGPFASAAAKDGSKHVGVASANAVGNNASYFAQNVATQVSLARPVEPELAQLPAYTPTRDDLTNLAGQKAPFAFAFALGNATNDAGEQAAAPVLSDRSLVSLNNALSYYDNNGYEASYLIMDLGTGRGIAGNVDVPIYGASSFKGPYCAYVVNKEFPNDIDRASSSRLTQVENTIVWVGQFLLRQAAPHLRKRRHGSMAGRGRRRHRAGERHVLPHLHGTPVGPHVVEDLRVPDDCRYLGSPVALRHLRQNRSLIPAQRRPGHHERRAHRLPAGRGFRRRGRRGRRRKRRGRLRGEHARRRPRRRRLRAHRRRGGRPDVLEEDKTVASIGTNITVRNKAGWIDGQDDDAVCDSGIVTINGRDYLITIMTNAPDSAAGEQAFAHLARTLLEIRGDLV